MNEPSVFNGPEVSMPKDARNIKVTARAFLKSYYFFISSIYYCTQELLSMQGVEHREWHNLFGIYMQMATALGAPSI